MADILVVEDSRSTANAVAYSLWNGGHHPRLAENGRQALERLREAPPELLILDYLLPDLDGMEVFHIARREHPELPIIIITGAGNEEIATHFLREGARDYIPKNKAFFENLPRLVERVLEDDRMRRDLRQKEQDLREAHALLEQRVEERTAEFREANARLQREILERRQVEAALKKSEAKYRHLIENAASIILRLDTDGNVTFTNDFALRYFGFAAEEIVGKPMIGTILPATESIGGLLGSLIANLAQDPEHFVTNENEHIRQNGERAWIAWTYRPLHDAGGQLAGILAVGNDITLQKKAQEEQALLVAQLQQMQKMEAIGTLAGGIAHDLNNILAVIFGNIGLAEIRIAECPLASNKGCHLEDSVEQVSKAAQRAKDLVNQILTFCRKSTAKAAPLEIQPILKESLKFIRSSLPSTIEINAVLPPTSGAVMADPTRLHQVIMNLCTNAAHAMRAKGGVLEVGIEEKDCDEPLAPGMKPGRFLRLWIKDQGHGMDAKTAARVFEPYFSTKEKGEGTGLGLAVVMGIITNFGGAVQVESAPGQGATFSVYLPLLEKTPRMPVAEAEAPPPRGTEHILLVDDEYPLLEIGQRLLNKLGYSVEAMISSTAALAAFNADPSRYDLVITDQTMPELTGLDLTEQMLRIRPDIPVILCTGYSGSVDMDRARRVGVRRFMDKPLSYRDMAKTIRSVLDAAKTGAD